jgi:outer membrane protein assembly factor BamB
MIGSVFGALAIIVWWLFFSRAPWSERLGAIILMIVGLLVTSRLVHASIAGGAMGALLYVLAIPVLALALVVWAVASRRLSTGLRRASMVATIVSRVRAVDSRADRWRNEQSHRFGFPLALDPDFRGTAPGPRRRADSVRDNSSRASVNRGESRLAGLRGSKRDSIIRGVRIETDWAKSPPVAIWRRPIGPGWSSFAVHGDLLYTQEQRGNDEVVACYKVSTGEPVWRHRDAVRFWESNGGAGPRATPTLSDGRVYDFGATGILNALDARKGGVVWSHNAASDTNTKTPVWGFTSSPLVVDDVVIVAASGTWPPTISRPAISAGSVLIAPVATAPHNLRRSTESRRSCC